MLQSIQRWSALLFLPWMLVAPSATQAQLTFDSATSSPPNRPLQVLRITPQGDAVLPRQTQLAISFNQPMVATGQFVFNPENIEVDLQPSAGCEWRWLDSKTLACHQKNRQGFQYATQYRISVKRARSMVSDASLGKPYTHSFSTQRPSVSRVRLSDWSDAQLPVIDVWFNQPVTQKSAAQALQFTSRGGNSLGGVVINEQLNPLHESLWVKYIDSSVYQELPFLNVNHQGSDSQDRIKRQLDERRSAVSTAKTRWRVVPSQPLPNDQEIRLRAAAGLQGIEGALSSINAPEVHRFRSLPEFKYLGLKCVSFKSQSSITVPPSIASDLSLRTTDADGTVVNEAVAACDPQQSFSLLFSVPVTYEDAGAGLAFTPSLNGGDQNYEPWSTRSVGYLARGFLNRRFNYNHNQSFELPLPERLKAFEQYRLQSKGDLKDFFGRTLVNDIDMGFLTSHRRPQLTLFHPQSVFESNIDSDLPVMITNLDELQVKDYRTVTRSGRRGPMTLSRPLQQVEDISYAVPVGIRDLLNGESGAVHGRLSSVPLTKQYGQHHEPEFFSQVTPFQVHVKFGHFSSTAWVTDLATGMPVKDAKVSLELDSYYELDKIKSTSSVLTDQDGVAKLPGIIDVDPTLAHVNRYDFNNQRWFVKVEKDQDLAFLPLDGHYETWSKVWPYLRTKNGHRHAWGFTAQGVYKAGDQIDYKLFVRDQSNRHWVAPEQETYTLQVTDPKGQTVHKVDELSLNEFGAFDGSFSTSNTAAVGWYDIQLSVNSQSGSQTFYPIRVLVSDFTPSPFKADNSLNSDSFEIGDEVSVTSFATMHAGGPYSNAEVRVTTLLEPRSFTSDHPAANGFNFAYQGGRTQTLNQNVATLDKKGESVSKFVIPDTQTVFGRLRVETAVRDDRGKYVAKSSQADFIGRDRFIGLKSNAWLHPAGKPAQFDFIVTDGQGVPVRDHRVSLTMERQVTRATRVKGAGNAYLNQYSQEWVTVSTCEADSIAKGKSCEFSPEHPGYHRISATSQDTKGRPITNSLTTWVTGSGNVLWADQNTNSVDIIADQADYKIGETAKLLIKNPYPGAQALITVERYGVLRTWQRTLEGSTPVVEIPIEEEDYPGVYVSVVLASPRVAAPIGSDSLGREIDLGKPAFKMGYLKIDVRDDAKEIDVKIKSDRKVYKPRDTVKLSIKADAKTGPRQAMELAVVVIDESVLSLNARGKDYYDPYSGFNRLDELGVANYNLLMRLIGRQKFEAKGANPGGGGGADTNSDLRNLMKFVAYWNPSVTLPKSGKAKLEFDLPDNLTGWRVLAIVVDKNDRMGLGDANFKVNKPTELRPVMPNQLAVGDRFTAGFSVLNRTNKARKINVELRASGAPLSAPVSQRQDIELQPFERKTVNMTINTQAAGELAFFARAKDSHDSDAVEHHIQVANRYVMETQASYGTSEQAEVVEPVQFPADIIANVGGVSVVVSPSVIGNVEGAFHYLRDYPYVCWEQRLSKALAASQYQQLKNYVSPEFTWSASVELPADTLSQAAQFQAPNGGMTYWINKNAHVSPYLSAYTALGFAWLAEQGHEIPAEVEKPLHAYLKTFLRKGDNNANVKTDRSIAAVALAALSKRGAIDISEFNRYQSWFDDMTLFAKAHFLEAAVTLKVDKQSLNGQATQLLNYAQRTGGKVVFQEPTSYTSPSMLSSPVRSNCALMTAFLGVSQTSEESLALFGDVPFKMARAITQRRGAKFFWANTQENLYCLNAFVRYSQLYESSQPNLQVNAGFKSSSSATQEVPMGQTRFTSVRDTPVVLNNDALLAQPNMAGDVLLNKSGEGRYYYSVRAEFAVPDALIKPINAGVSIKREYAVQRNGEWQILQSPYRIKRGELIRVDLFVSTPAPRNFVVIDDPVPGGLEPVNRDLATTSMIDAEQNTVNYYPDDSSFHLQNNWRAYGRYGYSFYHQELRHDSARFYSDYLPAGHYHLSYTAQAIADGEFSIKPVKAEEMYDPDVFGRGKAATLNVGE